MKTIWKFELPFEKTFTIKMPSGANILCVQQDQKTNIPCLWALVETDNSLIDIKFRLVGTGLLIDDDENLKYIGTYQYQKGEFVGHIFEVVVL